MISQHYLYKIQYHPIDPKGVSSRMEISQKRNRQSNKRESETHMAEICGYMHLGSFSAVAWSVKDQEGGERQAGMACFRSQFKICSQNWVVVVVHIFNPSTREAEAGGSL